MCVMQNVYEVYLLLNVIQMGLILSSFVKILKENIRKSGGRIHSGPDEVAIQNAIFTRKGTERAMRYAFEMAQTRCQHVTSATKSKGLTYSMPFWDEVFTEVRKVYGNIGQTTNHIDALAAFLVMKPQAFDVIVASNLFGDILTDLVGRLWEVSALHPQPT